MIVSDDRVAIFVAKACSVQIVPPYTCMGIERGGEIVGGAVFNNFTGADIHVTVAGKGWTPRFLREVGRYVFDKLRCVRITVITEKPNVVRIALRLGGEIEGALRNQFGIGRDAKLIGVHKDKWPFF